MTAHIYKPAKSAMQSGLGRGKEWVLEHEPESPRGVEPLMGWTSASDTRTQVRLEFGTKEEAVAYAERNGLAWTAPEPKPRKHIAKSYAENFRFGRIGSWTH